MIWLNPQVPGAALVDDRLPDCFEHAPIINVAASGKEVDRRCDQNKRQDGVDEITETGAILRCYWSMYRADFLSCSLVDTALSHSNESDSQ
jgi:hypothetical protein